MWWPSYRGPTGSVLGRIRRAMLNGSVGVSGEMCGEGGIGWRRCVGVVVSRTGEERRWGSGYWLVGHDFYIRGMLA